MYEKVLTDFQPTGDTFQNVRKGTGKPDNRDACGFFHLDTTKYLEVFPYTMKLAVAGKGGAGKTTITGTLARAFAFNGADVLAIDDDDDPNLAVALGLSPDTEKTVLPDDIVTPVESSTDVFPYELTRPPRELVEDFGVEAPDDITLLEAGKVEAGSGCFGISHGTVSMILSQVADGPGKITIMDLPNGIEHLGLGTARDAHELLIVVEPSYNSMETARKIRPLTAELAIPDVRVVGNKVRTDRDRELIEEYCSEHDLTVAGHVPFDDAIRLAERDATSPTDFDPDSRGVRAIHDLATEVLATPEG